MNTLLSIGNSARSNCDLSTDTLTTLSFFKAQPVWIQETMPNGNYSVNFLSQCRCLAIAKPMFADMWINFRTFFVPYRQVFPNWNDFISDTPNKNKRVKNIPCVSQWDMMCSFIGLNSGNWFALSTQIAAGDTTKYDFVVPHYTDVNKTTVDYLRGFVFTSVGRRAMNVLRGLGYILPFGALWDYGTYFVENWGNYTMMPDVERQKLGIVSLLPLMCYVKITSDWFVLPSYSDRINTLNAWLDTTANYGYHLMSQSVSAATVLSLCLDMHYSDDFFVNAWDSPVSPNAQSGLTENMSFVDNTVNASLADSKSRVDASYGSNISQYNDTQGTPILRSNGSSSQPVNVSQYILNALQKLSSYSRRNQLSGFRAVDRILARFGVKLDNDKSNRCYKLHHAKMRIAIDAVMSNSNTYDANGSKLGDYAGQGQGGESSHLTFHADEHGFLITVAYVVPYIKYFQGIRPHTQRINRTDFYIPEFDALGCEAIPSSTLFNECANAAGYSGIPTDKDFGDDIFGFCPRYGNFKTNPYALVNGDFAFKSRNVSMNQWHLFRDLMPFIDANNLTLKHNQSFTYGSFDASEYARMFQLTNDEYDGFILGMHIGCKASLPVKPLYDDDILNSDPDAEHSRKIDMQVGGSYLS